MPNSAVQIRLTDSPQSVAFAEAEARKRAREDAISAKGPDLRAGDTWVHLYLDAIITPAGYGIGGISLCSSAIPPLLKIITFTFPDAKTAQAVDISLLDEAIQYVKRHVGVDRVAYVYCASVHIHNAAAVQGARRQFVAKWLDMGSETLTCIRKKAVKDFLLFKNV